MGRFLLFALAPVFAAGLLHAGPIHDAAGAGNAEEVRRLIAEGSDVNEFDRVTGTPLHAAAVKGQLEVAEVLVAEGAAIDDPAGILRATPLHMAALGGNPDLVALLLAEGADVNARDGTLDTPLHFAADRGHTTIVELLISSGADLDARNQNGATAIQLAGREDHFDVVDLLIARGTAVPPVEPVTGLLRDADPENGRLLFTMCKQCHTIAKGDPDSTGPNLWGVLERGKARSPTFERYTGAFARLDGSWSYEDLNTFLASPEDTVPGTDMRMSGLTEPLERADVIVYLRSNGDAPPPLPE